MFLDSRVLVSVFVLVCVSLCHARRIESGVDLGWRTDLQEQREFSKSTVAWLLNLLSASHIAPEAEETEEVEVPREEIRVVLPREDSRRDTEKRPEGCREFFWKGRTAC